MPKLLKSDLENTVAPVGIKDSGKTTYMTVLIKTLIEEPLLRASLSVTSHFSQSEDLTHYRENRHKILFTNNEKLMPTQATDWPQPYLLNTYTKERYKPENKTITLWYDFAGEALENNDATDPILRYLGVVKGILIFIDPKNCKQLANNLSFQYLEEPNAMKDIQVLTKISEIIASMGNEQTLKEKFYAVIVNKIDLFKNKGFEFFQEDSFVWQPSPHKNAGGFVVEDFQAINDEVRNYVASYHTSVYGHLMRFMNEKQDNVGFFAVSTMGFEPDINNYRFNQDISPLRIEDPFYWLLWKMGNLPAIGENNIGKQMNHQKEGAQIPDLLEF